jgi:hypothetical protein
MLDSVALARRGIPVVAIAHDLFEVAARMQAKVAGMPSIAVQVIPRPPQGATAQEILASNPTLPAGIAAHLQRQMVV